MEQTINKVNEILASFLGDRYKVSTTDTAVLINGTTIIELKPPLIPQDVIDSVQSWLVDETIRFRSAQYHLQKMSIQNAVSSSVTRIKETKTGEINPLNAEKSL